MNYSFAGAARHHTNQPRTNNSMHGHFAEGLNIPAALSKLELRQLVAAMID